MANGCIRRMGALLWLWVCFLFTVEAQVNAGFSEPVLAICPGTCMAQETECNNTIEGTHCGQDAKCCIDNSEHVMGTGFDFSTLPTNLPEEWVDSDRSQSNEEHSKSVVTEDLSEPEENLGDFYLDSAPHQFASSFSADQRSLPIADCPGACIPSKHVGLCQYIVDADVCPVDKVCCATKEAAQKVQQEFGMTIIMNQNLQTSNECPGKCIPLSLSLFCDRLLPNYDCPDDMKCCNQQLTTTVIPEPENFIQCTGHCLPEQSTYFCHPPFQLVPGAVNCKESTICCMQVEEQESTTVPEVEEKTGEIGELASDDNGNLFHVFKNGEFKPLQTLSPEESLSSEFEYFTDVDTGAGATSIYRDSTGNLYQLSIIPREGLQTPMTFTEGPLEREQEDLVVDEEVDSEKSVVSIPDDSDDMEENMKDVVLPDEGEDLPVKESPIPSGERTMIRPKCPGTCISAFLKFTCVRNSATYDGFSCPGRLVCCASLVEIEEHEQYLKTLSPYFKAAQSVSRQHSRCGIAGFGGHTFGLPATAEKWCWQAAVINEQNQYSCGAAIIDNSWVITPAHCVTGTVRQEQSVYIRAGVTDLTSAADNVAGQTRKAQSIFVHPSHNSMSLDNDIALIKLKSPLELTTNVCVVCLPTSQQMAENTMCTVTGYGFLSRAGTLSLKLHEAQVPIVDDLDCIANVTDALSSVFILPSSSFCAGGHGHMESCQGDAGGPLVCEKDGIYELTGLVSWSLGCKREDVPSIYVKISAFMEWINQIISATTFLKALS